MKMLISFLFLTLASTGVYAETITTGNAQSSVKVETNTTGGTVETNISVEANGEKKTLESNKPGSYKLEVESKGTETAGDNPTSESASVTQKQASASAKAEIKKPKQTLIIKFIKNIFNSIKSFFARF